MTTQILIKIGLGNGLLHEGTKPLPDLMLTRDYWRPMKFHRPCEKYAGKSIISNYFLKTLVMYLSENNVSNKCHQPVCMRTIIKGMGK